MNDQEHRLQMYYFTARAAPIAFLHPFLCQNSEMHTRIRDLTYSSAPFFNIEMFGVTQYLEEAPLCECHVDGHRFRHFPVQIWRKHNICRKTDHNQVSHGAKGF